MMSSGLCTYCYCIGGQQKCVKPKCILPIYEFGCKPIFVDSTCCPVRYDCNTKSIGKSNLPGDRYKKTTNKHYERMSQRLERNRGCTVDERYYSEGQKMPRESNKPCDICFCIRGRRKCTPKKCSPPLRNCIPIVPKGQCCPSSYECGNSKELGRFQRSHQARQFDLFSLIFGDEQNHDQNSQNNMPPPKPFTKLNQEKGFLDSIRDGLQFIDKNGPNVEHILDKSAGTTSSTSSKPEINPTEDVVTTEEAQATDNYIQSSANKENPDKSDGFFDILLSTKTPRPELLTSTVAVSHDDDDDDDEDINWFDLLIGKDSNEATVKNVSQNLPPKIDPHPNQTEIYSTTTRSLTTKIYESTTPISNKDVKNISRSTEKVTTPTTTTSTTTRLDQFTTKRIKINTTVSTTFKPHQTTHTKPINASEIKPSEKNIYEIIDKRTRPVQLERVVTTTSSSTAFPIMVKTNPSILESDFLLDYVDPTLPPSLPNLDIIQFMPGDAVKTTKYPAITEKNVVLDPKLPNYQDYTADYEDYPPEPSQHTGFSPPTETEGGFIPKDPINKFPLHVKSNLSLIKGRLYSFYAFVIVYSIDLYFGFHLNKKRLYIRIVSS